MGGKRRREQKEDETEVVNITLGVESNLKDSLSFLLWDDVVCYIMES